MEATQNDPLHTLLFKEGRELVNIKFLPGTARGLTAARLKDAAFKAIRSAIDGDLKNTPPSSDRSPQTLDEFLAAR